MYSERQFQKAYTLYKIKADPDHYSLSDRILITAPVTMPQFGAEMYYVYNHKKLRKFNSVVPTSIPRNAMISIANNVCLCKDLSTFSVFDNPYANEALVEFVAKIRSGEGHCLEEMFSLLEDSFKTLTYEDVHNYKHLLKTDSLPILLGEVPSVRYEEPETYRLWYIFAKECMAIVDSMENASVFRKAFVPEDIRTLLEDKVEPVEVRFEKYKELLSTRAGSKIPPHSGLFASQFVVAAYNYSLMHYRMAVIRILTERYGVPEKKADSGRAAEDCESVLEFDDSSSKDSGHDIIDTSSTTTGSSTPATKDRKVREEHRENFSFLDASGEFKQNIYTYEASFVKNDIHLKEEYEKTVKSVKLLNERLIRKLREIKVYNKGGKNPGLLRGKLDNKNLYKYKTDKHIFYNNTYKQKESDLAVGVCLDVSGSMRGSGIRNGVTTLIMLHEALKALNINHCITTHTNHGPMYQCTIKKYQAFKEDRDYCIQKNYSIAGIRAESGNCDSGALYYMEKELLRAKNADKVCIMFSDGEPTECTGKDLRDQVKTMERKGIKVIGVGINYDSISEYYTDYANGKNLREMVDIVNDILEQYILKKLEES